MEGYNGEGVCLKERHTNLLLISAMSILIIIVTGSIKTV